MGISAVPGSGKTFTLEALIVDLILNRGVPPGRIGVFTYMRSARANLASRIQARLEAHGLAGQLETFTLHSLALKVLRQFHGRFGSDEIAVLEGYEQERFVTRLTGAWLRNHTRSWEPLLPTSGDAQRIMRTRASFSRNFRTMCRDVIRTAKNYRLAPEQITADPDSFLGWALPVYRGYQYELNRAEKLDYDDLGWRAVELLERDEEVRAEVQGWYDYLFEDESQDSSPLQENLLGQLSATTGNLVRVGDPNQSIMGTFTTAEPRFFRRFCRGVEPVTLSESSRSAPMILALANALVDWAAFDHPLRELRSALVHQHIQTATSGPANPPDSEAEIEFLSVEGLPEQEAVAVAEQAAQWVRFHPERTSAILVSTNELGARVLQALYSQGVRSIDLLRSNPTQRELIERLRTVTECFAQPASTGRLAAAFACLAVRTGLNPGEVRQCRDWILASVPENLLFPAFGRAPTPPRGPNTAEVRRLLTILAGWVGAARIPWDDRLRLVVQDLHTDAAEIALGHYIIDQLERVFGEQPGADWQTIADEIQSILEGSLNNLPSEIEGFVAEPGAVAVATTHRAKGLEWDQVFLTGLSAYEYPVLREDRPVGLYFLDGLDMRAEALAELRHQAGLQTAASATEQAFIDLAAEKLRVLYVGITRARRRLTLSVSSRDIFGRDQRPSRLFDILRGRVML